MRYHCKYATIKFINLIILCFQPLGPFAEPDPPSYNEIMGRNFPEVHDEAEEIEVSGMHAVIGAEMMCNTTVS